MVKFDKIFPCGTLMLGLFEGYITRQKSLEISTINQKSRAPEAEILLKNEKSRTLNVGVIYPSGKFPLVILSRHILYLNLQTFLKLDIAEINSREKIFS